jgi:hypothetical protein
MSNILTSKLGQPDITYARSIFSFRGIKLPLTAQVTMLITSEITLHCVLFNSALTPRRRTAAGDAVLTGV